MSFSVRHSHCHDLLMAKAKKLSLVERGHIVELHKQGLSHPVEIIKMINQYFVNIRIKSLHSRH